MRGGRVLSRRRPSQPSSAKRSCQRQTQVFDLPVRRMIATVPRPSALSRTISARQTCFWAVLRSRTSASRRRRSAGETSREIPVRMHQTRTPFSWRESPAGLHRQISSTSWRRGPGQVTNPERAICSADEPVPTRGGCYGVDRQSAMGPARGSRRHRNQEIEKMPRMEPSWLDRPALKRAARVGQKSRGALGPGLPYEHSCNFLGFRLRRHRRGQGRLYPDTH